MAKLWRKVCGVTSLGRPALPAARAQSFRTELAVKACPGWEEGKSQAGGRTEIQ